MKKLLSFLLALFMVGYIFGQAARSTPPQFLLNSLTINPAYAGSHYVSSLDISYFGSGEQFQFLYRSVDATLHGPLSLDGKNNLGLYLKFVTEGSINEIKFRPSYAYRITTPIGKIAFAAALGFNFFDVDDQATQFFYRPFYSIDASLGIYFNSERVFAGISSLNIYERLLTPKNRIAGLLVQRENPFYLQGGFVQPLNDRFMIRPAVLLKFSEYYELGDEGLSTSNELAYDLSATLIIEQNYWVTLFYGTSYFEELGVVTNDNNIQINRFGIALNYLAGDLRLTYGIHRTSLADQNIEFPVSHLFTIGYDFGVEKDDFIRFF